MPVRETRRRRRERASLWGAAAGRGVEAENRGEGKNLQERDRTTEQVRTGEKFWIK